MIATEKQYPYSQLQWITDNYRCAQCGGRLNIAWSAENDYHFIRCGTNIYHAGFTSHDTRIEKIKTEARMTLQKIPMDKEKMLARVNSAKFPQELTNDEKKVLVAAALTYGFDPLMNEISIYQGRPYVSIDGRYRKAQETGKLAGVESRPATEQEREAWQIPDGDYFFHAEVWVKGSPIPFIGWGRVFASETKGSAHLPVVKNPQRMAEKRAEVQALRKAFSIPLPSFEEIGMPNDNPELVPYDIESEALEPEAPKMV